MVESTKIYMGVPKTAPIPVYDTKQGTRVTATKMILTNTDEVKEAKLTVTVNTLDVMKNLKVGAGETKILDVLIPLESGDVLSLQQDVLNAINVTIGGTKEQVQVIPYQ
jgi:flagellar motor switch protein FliM